MFCDHQLRQWIDVIMCVPFGAHCAGAEIGEAAEKARFDVNMTCEIMSNTTAHILYGKLGVTAVAFWKNTTAQFYLENRKSPPSWFLAKTTAQLLLRK
jgi:hypothetical protein